ncbi:MAG TPA: type II toxin-antitoxin system RelE/ParE family toxin [Candidatus Acidoferrum sp.]|nr:type II toxin-antitoxin system RelE/ParE family toxin [Candidatus Acidoferrum sp.]
MARSKPYRLHPLSWLEIEGGDEWYAQRSAQASTDFVVAVFNAIESICDAPHRWPKYLHGTRRFVLGRFPFYIVYLDTAELVNIVAVAHSRRRPGYWRQRL